MNMDACEENAFNKINVVSFPFFTRQKRLCMGFCTFIYFLVFILSCVALAGSSFNGETMKNSAWTLEVSKDAFKHGTNAKVDIIGYFGLREAYFTAHNTSISATNTSTTNSSIAFAVESFVAEDNVLQGRNLAQANSTTIPGSYVKYASCSSLTSTTGDDVYYNFHASACNNCFNAGRKVLHAVGITIFFAIVLFILQAIRIWKDRVVFKVTLLVFAWMAFISLACAMGIWKQHCQKSITVYNSSYSLWSGPGYNCAAAAFAFNFMAFFVNLFTTSQEFESGGRGFQNFQDNGPGSQIPPASVQENQAFKPNQQEEVYKGVMIEDEL